MLLIDAIKVIKGFDNTAIISPNETYFGDMAKGFIGRIKMTDPSITEEIGFYEEIANFSRVLDLFEDPAITLEGVKLRIKEGTDEAYFMSSNIDLIKKGHNDTIEQIDKSLNGGKCVVDIEIDDALINRIRRAADVVDNASLVISSRDGTLLFELKDMDIITSNVNSFKIDLSALAQPSQDFAIEINPIMLSNMPKGGFRFDLRCSERTGAYRAIFSQDQLVVVIPCNKVE